MLRGKFPKSGGRINIKGDGLVRDFDIRDSRRAEQFSRALIARELRDCREQRAT